jgi:hypothetical protein
LLVKTVQAATSDHGRNCLAPGTAHAA